VMLEIVQPRFAAFQFVCQVLPRHPTASSKGFGLPAMLPVWRQQDANGSSHHCHCHRSRPPTPQAKALQLCTRREGRGELSLLSDQERRARRDDRGLS